MQDWTTRLTFMQQSVLITAIRGPDGIHKNHVSKKLIRWLRRCILVSAFDKGVLNEPWDKYERRGGSFTGPSVEYSSNRPWHSLMNEVVDEYMLTLDEVPHHFQLHFLHAAEIIGYCHPNHAMIGSWWLTTYKRLCNDMHVNPESEPSMQYRLGDNENKWRDTEEVRAD